MLDGVWQHHAGTKASIVQVPRARCTMSCRTRAITRATTAIDLSVAVLTCQLAGAITVSAVHRAVLLLTSESAWLRTQRTSAWEVQNATR
jgi:hypothetical protein